MPAKFDPSTRRETWVFQRTNLKDRTGKQCLKRLSFNFVEYNSSPDRLLEPLAHMEYVRSIDESNSTNQLVATSPESDGAGLVADFEIYDDNPFQGVHEFHCV